MAYLTVMISSLTVVVIVAFGLKNYQPYLSLSCEYQSRRTFSSKCKKKKRKKKKCIPICDKIAYEGKLQSPIALDLKEGGIKCVPIPGIRCRLCDEPYEVKLFNNGETVKMTFNTKKQVPYIDGGILVDEKFLLSEIYFHWKSEHTINGKRFPLEAHFVHYLKRAGNMKNALTIRNGVVVLAVLFQCHRTAQNEAITEIVDNMAQIARFPNEPISIKIVPECLLPTKLDRFFTYEGSLTTGNYTEGIRWIVFDKLRHIRFSHYDDLIEIYNDNGLIKRNNRELQEINDRKICYSPGCGGKCK